MSKRPVLLFRGAELASAETATRGRITDYHSSNPNQESIPTSITATSTTSHHPITTTSTTTQSTSLQEPLHRHSDTFSQSSHQQSQEPTLSSQPTLSTTISSRSRPRSNKITTLPPPGVTGPADWPAYHEVDPGVAQQFILKTDKDNSNFKQWTKEFMQYPIAQSRFEGMQPAEKLYNIAFHFYHHHDMKFFSAPFVLVGASAAASASLTTSGGAPTLSTITGGIKTSAKSQVKLPQTSTKAAENLISSGQNSLPSHRKSAPTSMTTISTPTEPPTLLETNLPVPNHPIRPNSSNPTSTTTATTTPAPITNSTKRTSVQSNSSNEGKTNPTQPGKIPPKTTRQTTTHPPDPNATVTSIHQQPSTSPNDQSKSKMPQSIKPNMMAMADGDVGKNPKNEQNTNKNDKNQPPHTKPLVTQPISDDTNLAHLGRKNEVTAALNRNSYDEQKNQKGIKRKEQQPQKSKFGRKMNLDTDSDDNEQYIDLDGLNASMAVSATPTNDSFAYIYGRKGNAKPVTSQKSLLLPPKSTNLANPSSQTLTKSQIPVITAIIDPSPTTTAKPLTQQPSISKPKQPLTTTSTTTLPKNILSNGDFDQEPFIKDRISSKPANADLNRGNDGNIGLKEDLTGEYLQVYSQDYDGQEHESLYDNDGFDIRFDHQLLQVPTKNTTKTLKETNENDRIDKIGAKIDEKNPLDKPQHQQPLADNQKPVSKPLTHLSTPPRHIPSSTRPFLSPNLLDSPPQPSHLPRPDPPPSSVRKQIDVKRRQEEQYREQARIYEDMLHANQKRAGQQQSTQNMGRTESRKQVSNSNSIKDKIDGRKNFNVDDTSSSLYPSNPRKTDLPSERLNSTTIGLPSRHQQSYPLHRPSSSNDPGSSDDDEEFRMENQMSALAPQTPPKSPYRPMRQPPHQPTHHKPSHRGKMNGDSSDTSRDQWDTRDRPGAYPSSSKTNPKNNLNTQKNDQTRNGTKPQTPPLAARRTTSRQITPAVPTPHTSKSTRPQSSSGHIQQSDTDGQKSKTGHNAGQDVAQNDIHQVPLPLPSLDIDADGDEIDGDDYRGRQGDDNKPNGEQRPHSHPSKHRGTTTQTPYTTHRTTHSAAQTPYQPSVRDSTSIPPSVAQPSNQNERHMWWLAQIELAASNAQQLAMQPTPSPGNDQFYGTDDTNQFFNLQQQNQNQPLLNRQYSPYNPQLQLHNQQPVDPNMMNQSPYYNGNGQIFPSNIQTLPPTVNLPPGAMSVPLGAMTPNIQGYTPTTPGPYLQTIQSSHQPQIGSNLVSPQHPAMMMLPPNVMTGSMLPPQAIHINGNNMQFPHLPQQPPGIFFQGPQLPPPSQQNGFFTTSGAGVSANQSGSGFDNNNIQSPLQQQQQQQQPQYGPQQLQFGPGSNQQPSQNLGQRGSGHNLNPSDQGGDNLLHPNPQILAEQLSKKDQQISLKDEQINQLVNIIKEIDQSAAQMRSQTTANFQKVSLDGAFFKLITGAQIAIMSKNRISVTISNKHNQNRLRFQLSGLDLVDEDDEDEELFGGPLWGRKSDKGDNGKEIGALLSDNFGSILPQNIPKSLKSGEISLSSSNNRTSSDGSNTNNANFDVVNITLKAFTDDYDKIDEDGVDSQGGGQKSTTKKSTQSILSQYPTRHPALNMARALLKALDSADPDSTVLYTPGTATGCKFPPKYSNPCQILVRDIPHLFVLQSATVHEGIDGDYVLGIGDACKEYHRGFDDSQNGRGNLLLQGARQKRQEFFESQQLLRQQHIEARFARGSIDRPMADQLYAHYAGQNGQADGQNGPPHQPPPQQPLYVLPGSNLDIDHRYVQPNTQQGQHNNNGQKYQNPYQNDPNPTPKPPKYDYPIAQGGRGPQQQPQPQPHPDSIYPQQQQPLYPPNLPQNTSNPQNISQPQQNDNVHYNNGQQQRPLHGPVRQSSPPNQHPQNQHPQQPQRQQHPNYNQQVPLKRSYDYYDNNVQAGYGNNDPNYHPHPSNPNNGQNDQYLQPNQQPRHRNGQHGGIPRTNHRTNRRAFENESDQNSNTSSNIDTSEYGDDDTDDANGHGIDTNNRAYTRGGGSKSTKRQRTNGNIPNQPTNRRGGDSNFDNQLNDQIFVRLGNSQQQGQPQRQNNVGNNDDDDDEDDFFSKFGLENPFGNSTNHPRNAANNQQLGGQLQGRRNQSGVQPNSGAGQTDFDILSTLLGNQSRTVQPPIINPSTSGRRRYNQQSSQHDEYDLEMRMPDLVFN